MSIPRSWYAVDAAALQSSVPIAPFLQPSVAVQRPSAARVVVRFLARWIAHSIVLAVVVLALASAMHYAALGRWLLDGLTTDTVIRFFIAYAALCVHIGAVLTLALGRIGRGGARHG